MKLTDIRDNSGAKKSRIRVGRGIGSGKGKTGGRGVKGQKARSGVAVKGFEGGQMPLYRRLPKRGFTNIFAKDLNEVNLGRIQQAVDAKKLDVTKPVTQDSLVAAGVLSKARDGVKILGQGEFKAKLAFEVAGASKSAQAAIEKAGGSVKILTAAGEATA
jgi:large subunit ribosomal protein L15